jgi:tellurite methyltransferase
MIIMVNSFEESYKKDKFIFGKEPSKIVSRILKYKKGGSVLDLGVGEGRNAIFLSMKGFEVEGVDISKTGVDRFLKIAEENRLNVKGIVEDITKFKMTKNYDIIISISILEFLQKKDIQKVIENMKKHTKKKGLNVIVSFTEDNPNKKIPYLFRRGELKSIYADWEILEYDEKKIGPEKHGKTGKPHFHVIASLLARKNA